MKTINSSTLKNDLCIGCGICKVVCPTAAIEMELTEYQEIKPKINDECISCGECVKYCPNTKEKIEKEALKINNSTDPNSFGLKKENSFYTGYDKDNSKRKMSASGGVTSALLKKMLKNKVVDVIIHAEMVEAKYNELNFKASLSYDCNDIDRKRSSFYSNIDFSKVLLELKEKKMRIAMTGTPCVIRGVKKLFDENIKYKNNKLYTIALPCSHNVNGQFIDCLASSLKINKSEQFKVNLRNKDNIKDANNFNNHFFKEKNDEEITLIKENRFKTKFTKLWRNYCFSMNVCHFCSDFWGYTADVSIKDAWGKWAKDPLGESMVIIRNKEIKILLENDKNIHLNKISRDTVAFSQFQTTHYKQRDSYQRISKNKFSLVNLRSGYFKNKILSDYSKNKFQRLEPQQAIVSIEKKMKKLELISFLVTIPNKILNKIKRRKNG